MTTIRPFLMFQNNDCEEAITFYVSLFPNSSIGNVTRYGADGPGKEGSIIRADFTLAGQSVLCIDSYVKHAFAFTPSFSFWVDCENEAEIDRLSAALLEGGAALMPLGNYGFSKKFCWLNDRFGVSWQLNLA
jgi:predicted 3-demethylubiquinone-9 3-methyltransferase (glyoxalase superfamily)